MAETKKSHSSSSEYSTVSRVLGVALLAAGAIKLGTAIYDKFDNDTPMQNVSPPTFVEDGSNAVVLPETTAPQETIALHIQPGDTAYDIARRLVGEDADWQPVADEIRDAALALGHKDPWPGDILIIKAP